MKKYQIWGVEYRREDINTGHLNIWFEVLLGKPSKHGPRLKTSKVNCFFNFNSNRLFLDLTPCKLLSLINPLDHYFLIIHPNFVSMALAFPGHITTSLTVPSLFCLPTFVLHSLKWEIPSVFIIKLFFFYLPQYCLTEHFFISLITFK